MSFPNQDALIEPGYGAGAMLLGSETSVIVKTLGSPSCATDYDEESWWEYPALGLDICVDRRSLRITALSLFREGIEGHIGYRGRTREGLGPGSSKEEISHKLGTPDSCSLSRTDSEGHIYREWVRYKIGIAFEFGRDLVADRVAVFPRE